MGAEITRIPNNEKVLLVEIPTKLIHSNRLAYFPYQDQEIVFFRYSRNIHVNNSFVFPQRDSPPQTARPKISNYVITRITNPHKMYPVPQQLYYLSPASI